MAISCSSPPYQTHLKPLITSHHRPHFPSLKPTTTHLSFLLSTTLTLPLPSFAATSPSTSDRTSLESILTSVDDFFNKYPFFVAGCTFIYLVVIPVVQHYLKKYKFISVLDAFRKLKDDPQFQLLDIRDDKSCKFLRTPNLRIVNKDCVRVGFVEGDEDEDEFVKKVLDRFGDPANTVICVLGK